MKTTEICAIKHINRIFMTGLMGICFTISIQAQTEGNWEMQGNIADSTSFIGTKNNACLRFSSNNIEHMRIVPDGRIGIGKINPTERVDVEGNISLTGDILFKGYQNQLDTSTRFLMVDKQGSTKPLNINTLKAYMGINDCYDILYDLDFGDSHGTGNFYANTLADWGSRLEGEKSILYTGSTCPTWVGIGTNSPKLRLDVRGAGIFQKGLKIGEDPVGEQAALYIENTNVGNDLQFNHLILVKNAEGKKILQLDEEGLLRSREIKVDIESWPDYVFKEDYNLLPLNEVRSFIQTNGHLPNVPSASEIEENGVNLGKTAKVSIEKIEELTLYLLELNDKIEEQDKELKTQRNLLEIQQETIQLQQQLIEELKEIKTNKK